MIASPLFTVAIPKNTGAIGIGLVLASVMTLVSSDDRLEISPVYEDLQTEEIYQSADGWRKPPMFESEWRAPRQKKEARIQYGYDSAHEQMRAREAELFSTREVDLNEPRPSSQFRINF